MPENLHYNHLIIGLGGTGGNILRSFRKIVYQNFGSDQRPKVNLRYLYVDSSAELMGQDDPSWTVLGHPVQLDPLDQLLIQEKDLTIYLDHLDDYERLKPWLGSRTDWANILSSQDASRVGAGQKRRLGRLLFAISASKFRARVNELVRQMKHDRTGTNTPTTATTFHVCCGLAGGTGSGSIVDAIAQIRSSFSGPEFRIIVYAQLPEEKPEEGRAGPNYHANGYAALVELNALSIGSWKPHDVLSSKGRRLLELQDAFNCCYLFNDTNEADVAVSLNDLPDIVASFLFQKIVQAPNMVWPKESSGNTILRQETYELNAQAKDTEDTPGGVPRRSRSFFSFGVKQIAYPEAEIRAYLSYSFALQAVNQLLFRNWTDDGGYISEFKKQKFNDFVNDPQRMEVWRLNEEHLTLSTGILESEINNRKWRPIGDFWKELVPNFETYVIEQCKDNVAKMLPELTSLSETAFNEQYRGSGVRRFYEIKRKDITDHVRELRVLIETDLFSAWITGTRSLHDNDGIIVALIDALNEQLNTIDTRISKTSPDSDSYKAIENRITENRKQWSRLGILSTAFGKHKTILHAQAEALIERYTLKTRNEGLHFSRELVQRLLQELSTLSTDISNCKVVLNKAGGAFQTAMESRLNDRGNEDIGGQMVRQYEPLFVRAFIKELSHDEVQQKIQTAEVRRKLAELLGDKQTFSAFADRIPQAVFENTVLGSCNKSAGTAHADAVASNHARGRVLDVSLMELLKRKYDGDEQGLGQYTRNIMSMAGNYLQFVDAEVHKSGKGIPDFHDETVGACAKFITIVAPEATEVADFRNRFCNALCKSVSTQLKPPKFDIARNQTRPQEVTIISITSVFPVRFIAVMKLLKEKYEKRLSQGEYQRAFLELHSEGESYELPNNQHLYDLFAETYKSADILPWVMLSQSLGLIELGTEERTGRKVVWLKTQNTHGNSLNVDIGPDLETVIEDATQRERVIEQLEKRVRTELKNSYLHVDNRKQLSAILLERVRKTGEDLGINASRYKEEVAAYDVIHKILELGD